jgi:hypothetical protein
MKIFLIIVAAIVIISALIIGYAYNQFTYKPDYFEQLQPVNMEAISLQARQIQERVRDELQKNGFCKLDGDEIMNIGLDELSKKTNIDIDSVLKKTKSEMVGGKFKSEALINVKALSKMKIAEDSRQYVDNLLNYLPDAMMEEVYVSFEGTPVNENGVLHFADDVVVSVGEFSENLSEINHSRNIKVDLAIFNDLGAKDIIINDNYIELQK